MLQLPAVPPAQDLRSLALAALFNNEATYDQQAIVEGLCEAFKKSNQYSKGTKKDLFQQRDFVYFLRNLRARSDNNMMGRIFLEPRCVVESLRRNFGGINAEAFRQLVAMFFEEIQKSLRGIVSQHELENWQKPSMADRDGTIEALLESLEDRTEDSTSNKSTISPWRYIALLDPTDSEAAVSLFIRLLIKYKKDIKLRICTVSDFAGDANDATRSSVIANIREAMAAGETVLLINSGPIRTNFYDVFNRYFSRTPSGKGTYDDYANVAVGTQSRPCAVHPNFKFVVHIPVSELPSCPLPFLDRCVCNDHRDLVTIF